MALDSDAGVSISPGLAAELEALEAAHPAFNVFKAVGLATQEIRHSHFLAYMLDPAKPHGLGDRFTRAFIRRVLKKRSLRRVGSRWQVRREWKNIDLLLVDVEAKRVYLVENKVGASEHGDQLARYRKTLRQSYPGYERFLIFLSPDGTEATDPAYVSASYDQVAAAVEDVLGDRSMDDKVRSTLRDYLAVLAAHVRPGHDVGSVCRRLWHEYSDELTALVAGVEDEAQGTGEVFDRFPRAARWLVGYRPGTKSRIYDLAMRLRDAADERVNVVPGYTARSYVGFRPREWIDVLDELRDGFGWSELGGHPLLFEFYVTRGDLMLSVNIVAPLSPALRKAAFEAARRNTGLLPETPATFIEKAMVIRRVHLINGDDLRTRSWSEVESHVVRRFDDFLEHDMDPLLDWARNIDWPHAG